VSLSIQATCREELPPLAWAAVVPRGGGVLALEHGAFVERFPGGFFEGAWEGDFGRRGFGEAANVFGSGAILRGSDALFVGPSHTLEPLYILQSDAGTTVSNSLAFGLRKAGLGFDLASASYGSPFSAIVNGLAHTPQTIELAGGRLMLLYHHNALLRPGGGVTVAPKPLPPTFEDFSSYRTYLAAVVGAVFANAAAASRHCRYEPIATLSSGYDSAAGAAVAAGCGCRESVSLATSSIGMPDSGRAAAAALGLAHTDFARVDGGSDPMLEAEFLATGMQGEDYVYAVFAERLRGRLLVTGFQGGKVWDKDDPPNPQIKRGDLSGCSLGEFRLRANFLHMPMAFIGIQRQPDLRRIANSAEMERYVTGTSYDRPVPRRILEEAGVERRLFAQRKQGASILLFQGRNRLSQAALDSLGAFCRRRPDGPAFERRLPGRLAWWWFGRSLYGICRRGRRRFGISRQSRLARSLAVVGRRLFGLEPPILGASHPRFTLLLMWAVEMVQQRYAPDAAPAVSAKSREIA